MILFADSEDWSDCADAQAGLGLGLSSPHMPKDTFLYGAAHMVYRCLMWIIVSQNFSLP